MNVRTGPDCFQPGIVASLSEQPGHEAFFIKPLNHFEQRRPVKSLELLIGHKTIGALVQRYADDGVGAQRYTGAHFEHHRSSPLQRFLQLGRAPVHIRYYSSGAPQRITDKIKRSVAEATAEAGESQLIELLIDRGQLLLPGHYLAASLHQFLQGSLYLR